MGAKVLTYGDFFNFLELFSLTSNINVFVQWMDSEVMILADLSRRCISYPNISNTLGLYCRPADEARAMEERTEAKMLGVKESSP